MKNLVGATKKIMRKNFTDEFKKNVGKMHISYFEGSKNNGGLIAIDNIVCHHISCEPCAPTYQYDHIIP